MLKVTGAATLKVKYEVDLPFTEVEFEALPTDGAKLLIAEAIKSQANRNAQTSNIDIWDYEEVQNTQMNALQAINHYLTHGERVDGVLHHIITKGFNLMQEALEFYANERNYLCEYSHNSDELMESVIGHDNGDLARKALEEIM